MANRLELMPIRFIFDNQPLMVYPSLSSHPTTIWKSMYSFKTIYFDGNGMNDGVFFCATFTKSYGYKPPENLAVPSVISARPIS